MATAETDRQFARTPRWVEKLVVLGFSCVGFIELRSLMGIYLELDHWKRSLSSCSCSRRLQMKYIQWTRKKDFDFRNINEKLQHFAQWIPKWDVKPLAAATCIQST